MATIQDGPYSEVLFMALFGRQKHYYNYLTDVKCFHTCNYLRSHFYWHKWVSGYTFVLSSRITISFRNSAKSKERFFWFNFPILFHPLHALGASTAYTLPFLFWAFAGVQKRNLSVGADGRRLSNIQAGKSRGEIRGGINQSLLPCSIHRVTPNSSNSPVYLYFRISFQSKVE